mmetsp:Transcript_23295/g.46483  ORF Transcript_23295/g.46483 Transcript_23295/m.46483 type:complete len:203 (-) Transcript_23295:309-917(-)
MVPAAPNLTCVSGVSRERVPSQLLNSRTPASENDETCLALAWTDMLPSVSPVRVPIRLGIKKSGSRVGNGFQGLVVLICRTTSLEVKTVPLICSTSGLSAPTLITVKPETVSLAEASITSGKLVRLIAIQTERSLKTTAPGISTSSPTAGLVMVSVSSAGHCTPSHTLKRDVPRVVTEGEEVGALVSVILGSELVLGRELGR